MKAFSSILSIKVVYLCWHPISHVKKGYETWFLSSVKFFSVIPIKGYQVSSEKIEWFFWNLCGLDYLGIKLLFWLLGLSFSKG